MPYRLRGRPKCQMRTPHWYSPLLEWSWGRLTLLVWLLVWLDSPPTCKRCLDRTLRELEQPSHAPGPDPIMTLVANDD